MKSKPDSKNSPLAQALSKIKGQKIEPIPKWKFKVKNGVFWALFLLTAFLGAEAFGVLVLNWSLLEFDLFRYSSNHWHPIALALPWFWFFSFVALYFLAIQSVKHTKKAYKVPLSMLVVVNVLISFIGGMAVFQSGLAHRFERVVQKLPIVPGLEERQRIMWQRADHGHLAGEIIELLPEESFELEDFRQHHWQVSIKNAKQAPGTRIELQHRVRVLGELGGEGQFEAEWIGPWIDPEETRPRPVENKKTERIFMQVRSN